MRTNTISHPVIDRMRYTHPSIITDWKKAFEQAKQKTAKPASGTMVKQAVTRTAVKPVTRAPVKQAQRTPVKKPLEKPETKSLVFIRAVGGPQIRRRESPKNFERAAFVLKACSKDKQRDYLTVLHIEQTRTGSRLVATDGRRLHVAEISVRIKSGNYRPVVTKDCISLGEPVTDITFPNWQKVVPENPVKRGVIDLANTGMGKDRDETEKLSLAFNSFVKETGEIINLRYLEDLTKKEWAVYCQDERKKAIVLKEEGAGQSVFAVIAPLSENETEAAAA